MKTLTISTIAALMLAVPCLGQTLSVSSQAFTTVAIPDHFGGDGTPMHPVTGNPLVDQGMEYDVAIALAATDVDGPAFSSSARRLAMNSIPNLFDWAVWDPSGRGDDHGASFDPVTMMNIVAPNARYHSDPARFPTSTGVLADGAVLSAYHSGEQVEWSSMFSNPADWGIDTADGLGADFKLSTGSDVPRSSNTAIRATDASGTLGFRLDGGNFELDATLPDGIFDVHLLVRDNGADSSGTAMMNGVSAAIGSVQDNFVHTIRVNNNTGANQDLNVIWGGGGQSRFAGVVVQTVPEPSAFVLAFLAFLPIVNRLRRRR